MTTSRLEGFSDGVFAVAITLLALDLAVPPLGDGHTLAHALIHQWPRYAAFVVSFLQIGIIWINHHVTVRRLTRPDHGVMMLNLLLLMTVVALPFATDLMASYLDRARGADTAMAVYCGMLAWMGITFVAFNWFLLFRRRHLLDTSLGEFSEKRVFTLAAPGIVPYLAAIGLAFVDPYISLVITFLIGVYYSLPIAVGNLT